MGQSSFCGGCLNKASSCNSVARSLHSFLCCERCAFWHAALQYFTILHAPQFLRLMLSSSPLPQLAQLDILLLLLLIDEFIIVLILMVYTLVYCFINLCWWQISNMSHSRHNTCSIIPSDSIALSSWCGFELMLE